MKLVVGLGNPGREYKNTRHNIGFMVLDHYLGKIDWKSKMESYFYQTEVNTEQVIFIKPLTYMNLSGLAVSKIVNFYKISLKDILIIQDDLDMKFGTYKIKRNSSSGGHNGIKSIISELHSDEFGRLKIGIGKNTQVPTDKYVLSKFSSDELENFTSNLDIFNEIINTFISNGIEETMLKYNNN
ncbi:MAG: aminoacyl-tRNA hydrolase [Firmicutes bacterium]|nr:aminoacyl-tRNA hydrolase [Bacillota bacterium]